MITILSRPYSNISQNLNGVYNGLPFVVTSDVKQKGNFRYIAEIFVNRLKVTELRHSPDVANDRKGIFDISRIVENYLAADLRFTEAYKAIDSPMTVIPYYVQFGEEYSRILKVVSTSPYFVGLTTGVQFDMDGSVDPAADGIIVGGSKAYNGWWILNMTPSGSQYKILTTYFGPAENTTWIAPTYRGRSIGVEMINGTNYLTFKVYRPTDGRPRFQVGNKIVINNFSAGTPINPFYTNSQWTITAIYENSGTVNGKAVDTFVTSAPYKYTVPSTYIIQVGSYDNITLKNLVSTATDRSYAANLARQYEQQTLTSTNTEREYAWPDKYRIWTPAAFNQIYTQQQYAKPLTDKPGVSFPAATDSIDICWGETYQLSWMGRFMNAQSSNKAIDTYMRIETWSSTTTSSSSGSWLISMGVAQINKTLTYVIPGNVLPFWNVGDYVAANVTGLGTFGGRIVSTSLSGGSTYIFTDIAQQTGGPGSIVKTIAVKYYDTLLQPSAMIYPCGTWNLKGLTEMQNMTCYKYMIYPIKVSSSAYYYPTGGVGNFNVESSGLNFKGRRDRIGQMTTFNIKSCCEATEPYKIAWLNKQGGFDFYKFTARVDKSLSVERTEFYKKMPNVQSNSIYGNRSGDRGRTNWNTTSIEKWVVNSDFLTQAELDWLMNIYESPEVYLVKEGRRSSPSDPWTEPIAIPLNIRNTDVALHNKNWKTGETGRLYIYTLEIEAAKNRVVQRGGRPATLAYKSLYE